MGSIHVHEFISLDGVIDTPAWTASYGFVPEMGRIIGAVTARAQGILLGRTTYEMFEPSWSNRTAEDDPGAPFFNDTMKYVVSGTLAESTWKNSEIIGGYDPDRIRRLKDDAGDLYVSGSGTLVRAMLDDGLIDELHLVDEAVGEQRARERAAAAHVEVADLVLQLSDRVRIVRPEDRRVPPGRLAQLRGDDVLRRVVEERRARVVLLGPARPRRLEHLVRRAPEQDGPRALGERLDRLAHLRVEAEVERPGRRVDDAVHGHELVDEDQKPYLSSFHGSASLW